MRSTSRSLLRSLSTSLSTVASVSAVVGLVVGSFALPSLAVVAAASAHATSARIVTAPMPGPTTAPATAPNSIGIRLAEVPANAADDPRARLYIIDHVAPGSTLTRRIEISNTSKSAASVAVYAAAASITRGAFVGAAAETANDLSSWTSMRPISGLVPASGTSMSAVTIRVPTDAAPGEHFAVAWAEMRAAPDVSGVVVVNRVGIRIYLSVGPGGPPAANFTIDSLTASRSADGRALVTASVRNSGGRALDLSGELTLKDGPAGLSAGPFVAETGTTLAVGQTDDVTILLDGQIPAGPWNAKLTLRSGLLSVGAHATITFPERGAGVAVPSETVPPWVMFAAIAGALAVLLLAAALVVRRWRLRFERVRG
ncbi:MAG: hypothetical protein QOJ77_1733, partial [Microbacteriaceae bacterium]|nr:hypothetical protein [Microbacteriaceae bacterium]